MHKESVSWKKHTITGRHSWTYLFTQGLQSFQWNLKEVGEQVRRSYVCDWVNCNKSVRVVIFTLFLMTDCQSFSTLWEFFFSLNNCIVFWQIAKWLNSFQLNCIFMINSFARYLKNKNNNYREEKKKWRVGGGGSKPGEDTVSVFHFRYICCIRHSLQ